MTLIQRELQERYIFIDDPWWPTEDTIAYYPLTNESKTADESGNHYDLTNSWNVAFGVQQWVDCWWFTSWWSSSWSCWLYRTNTDIISVWSNYTWLVRLYKGSETMYYNPRIIWAYNWALFTYASMNKISINDSTAYWITPDDWKWFLLSATYDWSVFKFYKNWVYQNETSYSRSSVNNTWLVLGTRDNLGTWYWDKWSWGMSRVRIEKKLRSANDIMSYFNDHKSLYWLN